MLRRVKNSSRRIFLAVDALAGRLDGQLDLNAVLAEKDELTNRLRVVIGRLHKEREYWYQAWMSMGCEFENAQNALIEKIDNLKRQMGNTEPDTYLQLMKKSFHDRHVAPQRHPLPGVKTDLDHVPAPPVRPSDAP